MKNNLKPKEGQIIIGIDKRVYFEYYELPLKVKDFHKPKLETLVEHEASKRLVEVENESYADQFNLNEINKLDSVWIIVNNEKYIIQNNQPCKADVVGKSATIIELTKE